MGESSSTKRIDRAVWILFGAFVILGLPALHLHSVGLWYLTIVIIELLFLGVIALAYQIFERERRVRSKKPFVVSAVTATVIMVLLALSEVGIANFASEWWWSLLLITAIIVLIAPLAYVSLRPRIAPDDTEQSATLPEEQQ